MSEIEASSRVYLEGRALVMPLPVINRSTSDAPETAAITFVLSGSRLVTLRYGDPAPFNIFSQRLRRQPSLAQTGEQALLGLLDDLKRQVESRCA